MVKKNKPDGVWADHLRLEKSNRAPLVKEKWPHVISLTFEFDYPGTSCQTSKFNVGPDDKAFFDYDCPHAHLLQGESCIQGGFELTTRVYKMIEARQNEFSEELVCHGMRYGSGGFYSCEQRLRCRVTVLYEK